MIINYSIKNPNLLKLYSTTHFGFVWNTRPAVAVITFLGKAVIADSKVYGSTLLNEQVGTAIAVDKTDE